MEDYKNCLFTKAPKTVDKMRIIRSIEHILYSQEISKVALDGKDDKRIILGDGITTRAIGHYLGKEEIPKTQDKEIPKTQEQIEEEIEDERIDEELRKILEGPPRDNLGFDPGHIEEVANLLENSYW